MKTTLELPDELMRRIKIRAVNENRRIKDVVAELLSRGLEAGTEPREAQRRVRLPLVECAHPADPDQEVTPERAAAILLAEEADFLR